MADSLSSHLLSFAFLLQMPSYALHSRRSGRSQPKQIPPFNLSFPFCFFFRFPTFCYSSGARLVVDTRHRRPLRSLSFGSRRQISQHPLWDPQRITFDSWLGRCCYVNRNDGRACAQISSHQPEILSIDPATRHATKDTKLMAARSRDG